MTTPCWTLKKSTWRKKSMSSYAFRQEFMASFEARGSEMFKEDWVQYGEEPEMSVTTTLQ